MYNKKERKENMYRKINIAKCPVALRPWMTHVDKYWSQHKDMPYTSVLKNARKTYTSKATTTKKPAKKIKKKIVKKKARRGRN